LLADNPLAFFPKIAASASVKSPVETPFKYSAGISASTLGTRAHILGQNGAGELLSIPVPHPGLTNFERADPRHQVALGQVAIADHDGSSALGSLAPVSLQILLDLVFDGRLEHSARPLGDELF
jgi:hypothetical protein